MDRADKILGNLASIGTVFACDCASGKFERLPAILWLGLLQFVVLYPDHRTLLAAQCTRSLHAIDKADERAPIAWHGEDCDGTAETRNMDSAEMMRLGDALCIQGPSARTLQSAATAQSDITALRPGMPEKRGKNILAPTKPPQ
ncbi:uncharacterized protein MYCFIDRAFT_199955 [Pseudocercospora fijiensis CIRAD86]|uniref:Uncharacterized protein n=1 Tax=Pseudocercospora fijiensis (strain CIRAD86) TaxID=383855 RepID=M3AN28_PSEFD|nr:uncharacterized protein MYCFIDRAFT_199955 [Pseudocercospora fijiensis CIRAD86]EME78852.1 hypothetical protein MYCFIDRAFT_199955 [Pseudocercospora fijiensis CIRAD86]